MAKRLTDEDLRLNIIINGDPARKEIGQLSRETLDLTQSTKKLKEERKKLYTEGKRNTTQYKELTTQIKANEEVIKKNRTEISRLTSELKLESLTIAELRKRHSELNVALRTAVPGTAQWKKLNAELNAVNIRMTQLRKEAMNTDGALCKMASGVNKYITSITVFVTTAMMYLSRLRKSIDDYTAFDQAMTDTQKTTNMTREEVEALSESLRGFDTRTARNELLEYARTGGKLGIAKGDIEGFTRAADILKISLGKDLGDNAEETIAQVGKLVSVFQLEDELGIEQAMLKSTSAVNDLGKSSTANEANIVEFLRRVGGVANTAGVVIADAAGLGATLDSLGVPMEVAGTTISQVITGMYSDTTAFAKAAKMSVADFKKLMAEDMNEAIVRVVEGLGADESGMSGIVSTLDSLNLDGTRATGVLLTLAQNTGKLREQQEISNQAFETGLSVMEEFNLANSSVEATTAKLKNEITAESVALGESLVPAYHSSLSAQAQFLSVTRIVVEWLIESKGAILGLVAAYSAYKTVLFTVTKAEVAYNGVIKIKRSLKLLLIKAQRASTAATVTQTGATKLATVATKMFSLALKATPLGWIAILLGAAAGAFAYFTTRTKEASDAMKNVTVEADTEAAKLKSLEKILKDSSKPYEDRKKALNELKSIMPDYNASLNTEGVLIEDNAGSLQRYIAQMKNAARARAATDNLIKAEQKRDEWYEVIGDYGLTTLAKGASYEWAVQHFGEEEALRTIDPSTLLFYNKLKNIRKGFDDEVKKWSDLTDLYNYKSIELTRSDNDDDNDNNNYTSDGTPSDTDQRLYAAKNNLKKQYLDGDIATEEQYRSALLALEIKYLNESLQNTALKDSERLKLQSELYDKLLTQKQQQQSSEDALESMRIKGITDARTRELAEYEQRKKAAAGNSEMLQLLEQEHNRNLAKIDLDRANAAIKQSEDEYNMRRDIIEARHKDELQAEALTKQERVRLKQQQTNELKAFDEQYLNDTLATLRQLNTDGTMMFTDLKGVLQSIDIDNNLLSESEKSELVKRIQEIYSKLQIAEDKANEVGYSFTSRQDNVDLFGISQDDWGVFFDNLRAGKIQADEMIVALTAIGEAGGMALDLYSDYDKMLTSKENAELDKYKRRQDQKEKANEERVEAGLMTEEQAAAESERMQEEYDAKSAELEIRQAKRQKAMDLSQAIIATALGIAKAIPDPFKIALATAVGAAQIAMIASTPIPGAEEGGFWVERAQDGRKFKANNNPTARGYISSPTLLVGENGMEYVIPSEAMDNPTAAPIINMFEAVRQRGQLRDFDFSAITPGMFRAQGYAQGGSVSGTLPSANIPTTDSTDAQLIQQLITTINKLNNRLSTPIDAQVTMLGKNGVVENLDKYDKMVKRGQIGG